MADHLDVPGMTLGLPLAPPGGDLRVDITDIYAFQKPTDPSRSVLIMNVNPVALAPDFRPDALYELKVDTNQDALADVALRIAFSPAVDGVQTATVRRAAGPMAVGRDNIGEVIISGAPVSFGSSPIVTEQGPYKFFAGRRRDPFFFDLLGFLNNLQFTGADFFANLNVFGIALELPNDSLGAQPQVGVWGRVLIPENGGMVQVERMGRPAINTVFMKGQNKVKFNRAEPIQDRARYTDDVISVLKAFGHSDASAAGLAAILLPDILTYDYSSPMGFLNGRKLSDDVIDAELKLLTQNPAATDGANTPHPELADFPYLGDPV